MQLKIIYDRYGANPDMPLAALVFPTWVLEDEYKRKESAVLNNFKCVQMSKFQNPCNVVGNEIIYKIKISDD